MSKLIQGLTEEEVPKAAPGGRFQNKVIQDTYEHEANAAQQGKQILAGKPGEAVLVRVVHVAVRWK